MDSTISRDSILQAKEKLGDRNAELIADILKLEKYNPQRKIGCCPNPNHQDNTPSFSYNPKSHSFYCFGCRYSVDLIDAWMSTGLTFLQAADKLFEEAEIPHNFNYRGLPSDRDYAYPKPEWADNKDQVYAYWHKRGISKATIDALGIMEDKQGNTCFPYYDDSDVLRCVKVRPSRAIRKGVDKSKCWWMASDTMHLLFNQNRINVSQPLIICCGEGDCATAYECGFANATSIPMGDGNLQFVTQQWDWLKQFETIILVHDNDEAGQKFVKEATRRLGEYRCKVVDLPETWKSDDGAVHKVKDLNELLYYGGVRAVIDAINNAKEREVDSVIDYTQVSNFNMEDVDGILTGFAEMDAALGKLYVGTTNIITGITGSGKSSFLSTIINQAVDQNYPVWVYSGELNNELLRSWIDFVHAGQAHIDAVTKDGRTTYRIKPEASAEIGAYYKNQLYFYRDTEDPTVSRILESIEASVRRYGVRVAIIDNMTSVALECNENNRWTKQDEFIRDCIDLAKKLDIILFLVLHPRKMDCVRPVDLFDLAGVTASANLSHRIFSLYRVQDADREPNRAGKTKPYTNCDVQCKLIKDRFGSALGRIFPLYYDVPSRRFYDTPETLAHRYAWDKGERDTANDLPYFDMHKFMLVSGQGGEPF